MKRRARGFTGIVYKEFLQLFRDPATLFFMFFPPLVQLIAFGFALDLDVRHIRTAVFNQDQRAESRALIDAFAHTSTFDVVEAVGSTRALEQAIVSGRVRVGLQIPPDYGARLQRGDAAQVLLLVDGSDATFANAAVNSGGLLGLSRSLDRLSVQAPAGTERLALDVRPRVLFNPDLRSEWFFVPGVVGLALHIATVFITSFAIVRERERGTLEQLMVTPLTNLGLMLGKLVPAYAVMLVELAFLLAVMRFLFRVPIVGSPTVLLLGAMLFLFTALSIGLLISTVARSQLQAVQMAIATILPSVFFSGIIFPLETMPWIFRAISTVVPLTYFARVLRGVTLRGATFADLELDLIILAVMGVLLVALATRRFRTEMAK